MKHRTIFHLISSVFSKTGVCGILIGAFAVNYYKALRNTVDIDFLIRKDDYSKILKLLETKGYKEDCVRDIFARLKGKNLELIDLDFMFVDTDTFEKIMKDSKNISIAKQKFKVPSLEHLIALKLHAIKNGPKSRGNKDLFDIVELIKANKVAIKSENFKNLCIKYGTGEIYNKILERI